MYDLKIQQPGKEAETRTPDIENFDIAAAMVRQYRSVQPTWSIWLTDKEGRIVSVTTNEDDEDRMPGMGH